MEEKYLEYDIIKESIEAYKININDKHKKKSEKKKTINTTLINFKIYKNNSFQKKKFIIYPNSKLFYIINAIIVPFVWLSVTYSPFQSSFLYNYESTFNKIWEIIIDVIFIIDFILNFFTAYHDSNLKIIDDRKKIIKKYVFGLMIIDILSSIPFSLIENNNSQINNIARISKIPKLLKFWKIIKLIKFLKNRSNEMEVKKDSFFNPSMNRWFYTIFVTIILINIISCFRYGIFIWFYDENSWVIKNNYLNKSVGELYIATIYWTVQTLFTVGYGDIPSYNKIEKSFAILIMFIGVFIYSFLLSSISRIFFYLDNVSAEKKNNFKTLGYLKKNYDIPKNLLFQIKKLIDNNNFYRDNLLGDLISDLTLNLKNELKYLIYSKKLLNIKYFRKKSKDFLIEIGTFLKFSLVDKNNFLFKKDELAEEIFFILSGEVSVLTESDKEIHIFKKGSIVGDWDIHHNNSKRYFTCKAKKNLELYILKKEMYEEVYNKFLNQKQNLIQKSLKRLNKLKKLDDNKLSILKNLNNLFKSKQENSTLINVLKTIKKYDKPFDFSKLDKLNYKNKKFIKIKNAKN